MDQARENVNEISPKFLLNFVWGSIAGIGQVLAGQPFDIVKIRMQNQWYRNPLYHSPTQWAYEILTKEGIMAFQKGTLAPLSTIPICTSLQFGLNGLNKKIIENYNRRWGQTYPERMSINQFVLAGAIAGAGSSIVAAPVEHIRIRMQSQNNSKGSYSKYTGSYHALKTIYQKHGLANIYKGYSFTLCRNIIAFSIFFGYSESQIQAYTEAYGRPGLSMMMLYGGTAGVLLWIFSYPFDVWKTKMQLDSFSRPKYHHMYEVVQDIYQTAGIRGFTKGFIPCIVRAPIVNGVTLMGFELAMKYSHLFNLS